MSRRGDAAMMVVTSERRDGTCVVHLDGAWDAGGDPQGLVDHLVREAGDLPLLVDLTGVSPLEDSGIRAFVAGLEASPRHATTALVHRDVDARRTLRAISHLLPVVPDTDLVLRGPFAAALVSRLAPTSAPTPAPAAAAPPAHAAAAR